MARDPPVRSAVSIDESFRWMIGRQVYRTPGAWAKVRVKQDSKGGDFYCDILFGVRTEGRRELHFPLGINRNLSPRFLEDRGRMHTVSRKVEDSNSGVTEDKTLMLRPIPGKFILQVKFRVSEPERMVWVDFEETELTEQGPIST